MEQPTEAPQAAPRRISQERQRLTGLPLYFQGYLSVRRSQCQYSHKLDISALTSVTNTKPNENDSAQFILMFLNEKLEVKADNCEYGKEWKGFILAVTKLSVPQDESLSPGQLTRIQEVLDKEKKRRILLNGCSSTSQNKESPSSKDYSSTATTMPACFYTVSRKEAIEMLENNPSCGNLILRPGSDSKNYAITVRHMLDAPCIKHYRVTSRGTSYIIELERQVTVTSLQDVISYFVIQTHGSLKPFIMQTCNEALQTDQSYESKTQ
ncbi:signal-transducing adaptor protein 1 isoform X2 [Coturnix japonica]|uniref:Signal transducing adaptor family member 1 n=1 Tax=Coturnix japonica TaxID=93934 RepID=A0A8C2SPB4_COTJA|nr:signal-transducing adaptor protein 1 isoform X2 [Coturnix japonica]